MSAIVLQQLFCFMTRNIKHIHRDWTLTNTFVLGYFDSHTSDLPFDLLCTLLLLFALPGCFKVHHLTGVLADLIQCGFLQLWDISPLLYQHFDDTMQSITTLAYFFPITEIGSS